ncbi:FkbM family methyltransferase [Pseudomonas nitritireducens]|uniref:FkbM family methyltransferase n=1 Tax=Pseudomonas nitroreducens TaxID=46680 RepID=A0A7W7P0T7_PSENT|nr:FkbM family methyltransferase [Pseudomonas nitritireducens]MBB4862999.1 FkbM family methyltransferase [Pseudomonas nitritireducens]
MSLVSYAQNFEDIMLWRALKSVDAGFYVDVGANDPDHLSVTKLFYERGWHGINIDPIPQWFERLEAVRTRDINLQVGASDQNSELLIYEFADTGLSTFDKEAAERNLSEHGFSYTTRTVATERLTDICMRHRADPIHFLKIDVEGAEELVLEGLDLDTIRPWIVLIESTLPLSQVESHSKWEHKLLAARYRCVYFDGLNRFYLAAEHEELAAAFLTPPNVFDGFRTHEAVTLEWQAAEARQQAMALQTENDRLEAHIATQFGELDQLKQEVARLGAVLKDTLEAEELLRSSERELTLKLARAQEEREEARANNEREQADIRAELQSVTAAQQDTLFKYHSLLNSTSWKVTAPLRFASRLLHKKHS